jgi:hypothetical protein
MSANWMTATDDTKCQRRNVSRSYVSFERGLIAVAMVEEHVQPHAYVEDELQSCFLVI